MTPTLGIFTARHYKVKEFNSVLPSDMTLLLILYQAKLIIDASAPQSVLLWKPQLIYENQISTGIALKTIWKVNGRKFERKS